MNVKLPVGLQGISEGLFYNCSSLKNIDIPGSVTYVVEGAFNKCDGLTDVFYSGTRAQWDAISIASYNDPLKNAAIHCVDAVKNIEDLDITIEDAVFNGGAMKPEITIKDGDTVLTEGTDYVVTYECNTNAGVGIAVISGTGAYTGTDAESFKILPKPITPVIELSNTTFVYNRSAQKPEVTVKDGETVISDLDYVVTWPSSSIAVGQYKISVQMKNNYSGSGEASYEIIPIQKTPVIKLSQTSFLYNKNQCRPVVEVYIDDDVLNLPSYMYTVELPPESKDVGTYEVSVSLRGIYVGTATAEYTITPKPVKPAIELSQTEFPYNGKEQRPTVTVKDVTLPLTEADYDIVWDEQSFDPGTYKVAVTLKGNYTGSGEASYVITKEQKAPDVKLSKTAFVYDGKEHKPEVTVSVDGTKLEASDYTVEWPAESVAAGTYQVGITLKGSYSGTASATYRILPGKTTRGDMFNLANNVKITWNAVPGAKYYKVYRSGLKDPVFVTSGLIGYDNAGGLVNGRKYTYKIVASLTGKGDSSGDSTLSYSKVMYRLKTVAIRSVKNTEPGKVTVKYDKTTSGDSYVLQYCERQDMVGAKTKVVLGANNTSYVIGGLKKGKTYYISIRVRKKVNGIDYYTTFGVAKKVTITK